MSEEAHTILSFMLFFFEVFVNNRHTITNVAAGNRIVKMPY